jgi:hypothetical protein
MVYNLTKVVMQFIQKKYPKNFDQIFHGIESDFKYCIMGKHKTKFVYDELTSIGKKGFTAEIGVFMGFTSKVIALSNYNNTHFCYDTFEGVVKSDPKIDIHKDGDFSCNLDEVKRNINLSNVVYKKGTFPETFAENNLKFVFVHSDTDTYHGTKTTFDKFADIMHIGVKILFDDYKFKNCHCVEKSVHEFYENNKEFFSLKEVTHQCVLTKIK